jgi:lipoate-protein ligase A
MNLSEMVKTLYVSDLKTFDAATNLAREHAAAEVLASRGYKDKAILLFYRFNLPSVILSRKQAIDDIHLSEVEKAGIGIYRRMSGGGSILQTPNDINFGLIFQQEFVPFEKVELLKTQSFISEHIANFLGKLGINGEVYQNNSIFVNGDKISGIALYQINHMWVGHGYIHIGQPNVAEILRFLKLKETQKPYANRLTSVSQFVQVDINNGDFNEHLVKGFVEFGNYDGQKIPCEIADEIDSRAAILRSQIYANSKWTKYGQRLPDEEPFVMKERGCCHYYPFGEGSN